MVKYGLQGHNFLRQEVGAKLPLQEAMQRTGAPLG
jgi:hypothetical protein